MSADGQPELAAETPGWHQGATGQDESCPWHLAAVSAVVSNQKNWAMTSMISLGTPPSAERVAAESESIPCPESLSVAQAIDQEIIQMKDLPDDARATAIKNLARRIRLLGRLLGSVYWGQISLFFIQVHLTQSSDPRGVFSIAQKPIVTTLYSTPILALAACHEISCARAQTTPSDEARPKGPPIS